MNALDTINIASIFNATISAANNNQLKVAFKAKPPSELITLVKNQKPTLLSYFNVSDSNQTSSISEMDYRAIRAYALMLEKQRDTLKAGGYDADDPAVLVSSWRRIVMRKLGLNIVQMDSMERRLIQSGAIAIDSYRNHITIGDAVAKDDPTKQQLLEWQRLCGSTNANYFEDYLNGCYD